MYILYFLVKDVYGYFRAIFKTKEVSQRALDLTADALGNKIKLDEFYRY